MGAEQRVRLNHMYRELHATGLVRAFAQRGATRQHPFSTKEGHKNSHRSNIAHSQHKHHIVGPKESKFRQNWLVIPCPKQKPHENQAALSTCNYVPSGRFPGCKEHKGQLTKLCRLSEEKLRYLGSLATPWCICFSFQVAIQHQIVCLHPCMKNHWCGQKALPE